jgi:hypothetical protein
LVRKFSWREEKGSTETKTQASPTFSPRGSGEPYDEPNDAAAAGAAALTAKGGPLAPPGSMPSKVPVNPIANPTAGGGLNKLGVNKALKPVMDASKNISKINTKMQKLISKFAQK